MAQLVEHHLAKVGVAGSNPVVRSGGGRLGGGPLPYPLYVVWLGSATVVMIMGIGKPAPVR